MRRFFRASDLSVSDEQARWVNSVFEDAKFLSRRIDPQTPGKSFSQDQRRFQYVGVRRFVGCSPDFPTTSALHLLESKHIRDFENARSNPAASCGKARFFKCAVGRGNGIGAVHLQSFLQRRLENLPAWQKRGVGLYWENYLKQSTDPRTGDSVTAQRRRIKRDMELPIGVEYATFIANFVADAPLAAPAAE